MSDDSNDLFKNDINAPASDGQRTDVVDGNAPEEEPTKAPSWFKALVAPFLAILAVGYKLKGLLLLVLKFPLFKFIPLLLKTGGTMFLSVWFYALAWGLWFGVGFVALLLIHEMGHYIAARKLGLNVGAPVFIPFLGAVIALKEVPRNAWIEAQVGIAGPMLGALGAVLMHGVYLVSGNEMFAALAYTGYLLNLFNLAPVGVLDGGRVVTVLSRWLWLVGLAVMVGLMFYRFNFILLLVVLISLPRLFSLFRPVTEEEARYFEATPSQRQTIAFLYFGLIGFLSVGMMLTMVSAPGSATVS